MRPFMATYRAAASQKSRISYVRGSIERFRSGSALSVPTDIRQPSSPPRVPFCAGEKKTSRLPRNPVKEKERERKKKERKRERKCNVTISIVVVGLTAYRTRSRIPPRSAVGRQREGEGSVSKRKRVHNESCRCCEFHCGKIVQFLERRCVVS